MAFFLKTGFKTGSGEGDSSVYRNFQQRQILIDRKYRDPYSGDISSSKYFDETKNNINLALQQGPTAAKKITLLKDLEELYNDEVKFDVGQQKIGKEGLEAAKSDMEDTWKNLWSNKSLVKTGQFGVLTQMMESQAEEAREEILNFKKQISESTTNEEVLDDIQKIVDYYDEQASFYRGATVNPQRYRLDFNTNENGELLDVTLKNVNDSATGYADTHQTTSDGFAIYGKPNVLLTDESGQKAFNIGGTLFTGLDTDSFYAKDDASIDPANFAVQDQLNLRPGVAMRSPSGTIYIKNDDGSYTKSTPEMAKELGVDLNDPVKLSDKNVRNIERSFEVTDYNDRHKKRQEIIERGKRELDELLGDDIGRYSPLEQVFTEGPKRFFKKAWESAKTEHEVALEQEGPTKKKVRAGLRFAGSMAKQEAKRQIQSKVDTAKTIFSGLGAAVDKVGKFAKGLTTLGDRPTKGSFEQFKP